MKVPRGGQGAAAFMAKHGDKISDFYRDPDGWWIDLKPGWMSERCSESHTIHETTVAACKKAFKWVEPWPDDPDLRRAAK